MTSARKSQSISSPKLVVGLRPSIANVTGNNPKDRYGLAKVPFSLIPSSAEVFMALGFRHGAKKYGPFNWRVEPIQGRIYLEAAKRHLGLLLDGEDFDRDTGLHHGCFILATVAIYMDALVQGTLIDNRAIAGRAGDLVSLFNELPGQDLTRSDLVSGFKRLVPNGHLLIDSLEEPAQRRVNVLGRLGPTTKKPSHGSSAKRTRTLQEKTRKAARHARR